MTGTAAPTSRARCRCGRSITRPAISWRRRPFVALRCASVRDRRHPPLCSSRGRPALLHSPGAVPALGRSEVPPSSPGKPARFPERQKPSRFRYVSEPQHGLRTEFRPFSRGLRPYHPPVSARKIPFPGLHDGTAWTATAETQISVSKLSKTAWISRVRPEPESALAVPPCAIARTRALAGTEPHRPQSVSLMCSPTTLLLVSSVTPMLGTQSHWKKSRPRRLSDPSELI